MHPFMTGSAWPASRSTASKPRCSACSTVLSAKNARQLLHNGDAGVAVSAGTIEEYLERAGTTAGCGWHRHMCTWPARPAWLSAPFGR
ncbi:hypothetical protein MPL1032_220106 [Mesorhizobium plurifarium]|uniref:Uncharacterized protein n=1 Tax=Mesorhizobium plurifarium TaxID=69974 RepID=A0A0K2VZN3_MESPL|nr:hypothetical protein MPL1032_220106 [Mesorhizobium plurifarium]